MRTTEVNPWLLASIVAAAALVVIASRRGASAPADSSSADTGEAAFDWSLGWGQAEDPAPYVSDGANMPDAGGGWLAGIEESDTAATIMATINRIRGTSASQLKPSAAVQAMLRKRERLMLERYELGDGGWTIGYGHFTPYTDPANKPPDRITAAEAERIFLDDIEARAAKWVRAYVTAPLTQSQFDALVHFAFNVSPKATLAVAAEVNAGRDPEPVMVRYVLPGSKFERGLRNRRAGEIALYRAEGIAQA